MQAETSTPVIIVGAGPVGLALALDLAYHGICSTVIEQGGRTGTQLLGKAGGLNERTMEFCRRWGIRDHVSTWGAPPDHPNETMYCTSIFGGYSIGRDRSVRPPTEFSPEKWTKCPQTIFDPVLSRAALATGKVSIEYETRFETLVQDADGVTATLTDVASGRIRTLRGKYLVACDGATSTVRSVLGVPFDGKKLDYSLSIMLRIEKFEEYHQHGNVERFMFIGPRGTWANITSMDYRSLWRFVLVGSEKKLDLATLNPRAEICRAFGRDDIPFEILRVMPWRRSECIAGRFRVGRVLIAGDAAHTTSPTGAHGMNTGMGDVVALGWTLSAVLKGWGAEGLLDAYELERRPIAIRNCSSSTQNYKHWVGQVDFTNVMGDGPLGEEARANVGRSLAAGLQNEWNALGIVLGYRYEGSPIVVPDGTPAPPDEVGVYVPTARPGHRAPHAWLPDGRSMLDLFGRSFVLLKFGGSEADTTPLEEQAGSASVPLSVIPIGDADAAALYERRLVLVRPDGHVAWRGDRLPTAPEGLLSAVTGSASAKCADDVKGHDRSREFARALNGGATR